MTTICSCVGGEERICFLDDEIIVPLGTMRETGDFVRVQNAKLFFLGRKDNQIKRHGKCFNIECLQQVIKHLVSRVCHYKNRNKEQIIIIRNVDLLIFT